MKQLNILMTSDDFNPHITRVGVYLKNVIPELIKLGHKITIITSNNKLKTEFNFSENLKFIRIDSIKTFNFPQALLYSKQQLNILSEQQFDLIHNHYLSLMMNTVFLFYKNKLPQIMTYHMTAEHISQTFLTKLFKSFIKKSYMKRLLQMNVVIVPSLNHLQDLQIKYLIPNLHFLSNPNPLEMFSTNINILKYKENKFSQKNKLKLLCVSRLASEKVFSLQSKLFILFITKRMECELIIICQGPEQDSLKKIDHKLNTKIQFVGFKEPYELKNYYLESVFFLLPSLFENQGLVHLESFSFGTPCQALQENISAPEMISSEKMAIYCHLYLKLGLKLLFRLITRKKKCFYFPKKPTHDLKKQFIRTH